jgi:hypothetical protein
VDVGYWWVMGKKTQIAADACALAAAAQLPASPAWNRTECVVGNIDYAKTNLPGNGQAAEPKHLATAVKSPYNAGPNPGSYVEAQVTLAVRTFFGRFIGKDYVIVSRRAVAEYSAGGPGNYAIYSHSNVCSSGQGLEFNGNVHAITGRVHSQGQFQVNNGGSQPFWAKEGTRRASCGPPTSNGTRFGGNSWTTAPPSSSPTTDTNETWPEWFRPADFGWPTCSGPNFAGADIDIKDDGVYINGSKRQNLLPGRTIPPGIYCATNILKISGASLNGQITALAREILMDKERLDLRPYASNGVVAFQLMNTDTNTTNDDPDDLCTGSVLEMKFLKEDGRWQGKVFAPCGRILIDANRVQGTGALYGKYVKINGDDFKMTGTGGSGGLTKAIGLVQ